MRRTEWIMAAAFVSLAACGGATSPMGGGGGVTGGGGPVGQVIVGNIFFQSAHNGSVNPAVDTIAAGDSITWKWNADGSHSVQSTGVPPAIFRNSVVMTHANDRYTVTFRTPGTYPYDCGVHGASMTGRIVVQ